MRSAFPFEPPPGRHDLINLRDNENPFGGPQRHYPDNTNGDLVAAYVRALDVVEVAPGSDTPGWHWGADNILITRGAADALDLVFRAFFDPGADAVAVTPPTFAIFDELATVYGVARRPVPLLGEDLDRLDVGRLMKLPVKGVLLCDPGNPTGTCLAPEDVLLLLDSFDGLVVIDEAYVECSGRPSYRHLIPDHPNLVVLRSMSKALGMAALRLGAVLAHPELVLALRKVRLPFALPGPVTAQAMNELSRPALLRAQIETFAEERDRFAAELARCPGVGRVFAEAGFVTVEGDAELASLLRLAGFDTLPEPMGWPGHVRISIGRPSDNSRLIAALKTTTARTSRTPQPARPDRPGQTAREAQTAGSPPSRVKGHQT
ncbi:aminotransferase class I/II-fold pyridoxal phosphate-dependent enzyme [Streptosporangium carneum]|uniref:Aminotransferase n=1 Tax=Streptosporangium carneum TaxID=47481 RepID=A0A9W6MEJ0_9ACTN|nr:aminotransferase class I/II-fold pyridoxal phosphate-dependent enzyme [Streptosporangium carneum]GLK11187.1 histidinol-phosphate aminotransferase [Streptosporangium carneum]